MRTNAKNMAIMFADLGGSSALYKSAGNLVAKSSIDTILNIVRKIISYYKGVVVKTIGDELMCSFANTNDCLAAAITAQKRLSQQLQELNLCINIGISFGETIVEKSDLFGDSVNQAAHLTNLASGGQILLSHASNQLLNQELSAFSKEFDRITYKGSQESALIYRVFWQDETNYGEETKLVDVEKKSFHD
ncbi:MAG: adenylate/guanylate cyclase domain-containing protein, partial [Kangiellaceae bacterium]|nr:adenylate/guanylate cyclase domain-containing protein [Kangiellaceae bacterium]